MKYFSHWYPQGQYMIRGSIQDLELEVFGSGHSHLVDRPTQLIYISDIYLLAPKELYTWYCPMTIRQWEKVIWWEKVIQWEKVI